MLVENKTDNKLPTHVHVPLSHAQRNTHLHIHASTHTQFASNALYGVHIDELVVVVEA